MGVDIHGLYCLLYARKYGPFGSTITLGRQSLSVSASQIRSLLCGYVPEDLSYCERLLQDGFGSSRVDSIDYSDYERATITHDLNVAVPAGIGAFETVIDFGTIEHVFSISTALANVRQLCRVGGQILHVSPADNFCGHGFWQISPELFFSLYSERNGFTGTEVFLARRRQEKSWYRVTPPRPGRRIPLKTRGKTVVICRTVRSKDVASLEVQQSDYVRAWANKDPSSSSEASLYRLQAKYFRRVSTLNPHLTKVKVSRLLSSECKGVCTPS